MLCCVAVYCVVLYCIGQLRASENAFSVLDAELQRLSHLSQLRELELHSASLTASSASAAADSADSYRLRTVHLLPQLTSLDGAVVEVGLKVDAHNAWGADAIARVGIDLYHLPFGAATTQHAFWATAK